MFKNSISSRQDIVTTAEKEYEALRMKP